MRAIRRFLIVAVAAVLSCTPAETPVVADPSARSITARFVTPEAEASVCGTAIVQVAVANASAPFSVTFFVDDEKLVEVKEPPYWASLPTLLFNQGPRVLAAVVADSGGHTARVTRKVTVVRSPECDNPPAIAFDRATPVRASMNPVPLKFALLDDFGVTKVQLFMGTTQLAELTEAPFTAEWDPSTVDAGSYDLKAVAFDARGQTGLATHSVKVVRVSPTVTLASPTEGQQFESIVKLAASVTSPEELERVEFFVDDTSVGVDRDWPYEVTLPSLPKGAYVAHAVAWDVLGNSAASPPVGFTSRSDCTSKYDCEDGKICVSGKCEAASSSCLRDDQCPRGFVCSLSRTCVPGCAGPIDCTAPLLCNPRSLQCEQCSHANPCPTGQSCSESGECIVPTSCTTSSACPDGQICRNGSCGLCTADVECAVLGDDYVCGLTGLCANTQCSDAECQAYFGTPRGYCHRETKTCELYDCLADSDCVPPQTCDLTGKICVD